MNAKHRSETRRKEDRDALEQVKCGRLRAPLAEAVSLGDSAKRPLAGYRIALAVILILGLLCTCSTRPSSSHGSAPTRAAPTSVPSAASTRAAGSLDILVDDFVPQPHAGVDAYPYNRLGGDRGAINNSRVEWGAGRVTTTLAPGFPPAPPNLTPSNPRPGGRIQVE